MRQNVLRHGASLRATDGLFWTLEAIQDREEIYDHIDADNPLAALELDELIAEKTLRLVEYPISGRKGRVAGTRELVAHPNYIVVYDIVDGTVRVLRILHAAKQWPSR